VTPVVFYQTVGLALVAVACLAAYRAGYLPAIPIGFHEVGGVLVALTLGFRANSAYARYWEARTLWGGIVNASRNLHRLLCEHGSRALGQRAAPWIALFAHATRSWLRDESVSDDANRLLQEDAARALSTASHPPLHAARQLSALIAAASDPMGPWMAHRAEQELGALVDRLGGCERIRRTPTPIGYVVVVRQIVLAFMCTLPLAIMDDLGWWTPAVVVLVGFPVFAIEALGAELDDPFGHDPNDLPLTRITGNIERDVMEKPEAAISHRTLVR
jgi:putative membrane protein